MQICKHRGIILIFTAKLWEYGEMLINFPSILRRIQLKSDLV